MSIFLNLVIVLGTAAAMETVAWFVHKHVMHGWGWRWHRSHHIPARPGFQENDFFALVPALISVALIWLDDWAFGPLFWAGLGMALYGVLYLFVHEGLAHGRWPLKWRPRHRYVKRLIQAHRLHHAVDTRDGGVSFGFLYAPPIRMLRDELRERQGLQRDRVTPRERRQA